MITVGYIRCDLDLAETMLLQPPSGAPVFHAREVAYADQYGRIFRLPGWQQE